MAASFLHRMQDLRLGLEPVLQLAIGWVAFLLPQGVGAVKDFLPRRPAWHKRVRGGLSRKRGRGEQTEGRGNGHRFHPAPSSCGPLKTTSRMRPAAAHCGTNRKRREYSWQPSLQLVS